MVGELFSILLTVGFVVIVVMMVFSTFAIMYFVMRRILKLGE